MKKLSLTVHGEGRGAIHEIHEILNFYMLGLILSFWGSINYINYIIYFPPFYHLLEEGDFVDLVDIVDRDSPFVIYVI